MASPPPHNIRRHPILALRMTREAFEHFGVWYSSSRGEMTPDMEEKEKRAAALLPHDERRLPREGLMNVADFSDGDDLAGALMDGTVIDHVVVMIELPFSAACDAKHPFIACLPYGQFQKGSKVKLSRNPCGEWIFDDRGQVVGKKLVVEGFESSGLRSFDGEFATPLMNQINMVTSHKNFMLHSTDAIKMLLDAELMEFVLCWIPGRDKELTKDWATLFLIRFMKSNGKHCKVPITVSQSGFSTDSGTETWSTVDELVKHVLPQALRNGTGAAAATGSYPALERAAALSSIVPDPRQEPRDLDPDLLPRMKQRENFGVRWDSDPDGTRTHFSKTIAGQVPLECVGLEYVADFTLDAPEVLRNALKKGYLKGVVVVVEKPYEDEAQKGPPFIVTIPWGFDLPCKGKGQSVSIECGHWEPVARDKHGNFLGRKMLVVPFGGSKFYFPDAKSFDKYFAGPVVNGIGQIVAHPNFVRKDLDEIKQLLNEGELKFALYWKPDGAAAPGLGFFAIRVPVGGGLHYKSTLFVTPAGFQHERSKRFFTTVDALIKGCIEDSKKQAHRQTSEARPDVNSVADTTSRLSLKGSKARDVRGNAGSLASAHGRQLSASSHRGGAGQQSSASRQSTSRASHSGSEGGRGAGRRGGRGRGSRRSDSSRHDPASRSGSGGGRGQGRGGGRGRAGQDSRRDGPRHSDSSGHDPASRSESGGRGAFRGGDHGGRGRGQGSPGRDSDSSGFRASWVQATTAAKK